MIRNLFNLLKPKKSFIAASIPESPFSREDMEIVIQHLLDNISTKSHPLTRVEKDSVLPAIPGAVIAAPAMPDNKFSQSYYFHWVRDGALSISSVVDCYLHCENKEKKAYYLGILVDYIGFVEKIQSQPWLNQIDILGDPKFNVDGTVWTESWGRPQIGGAAAQALTLLRIATIFLDEGIYEDLVAKIYNENPSSLMKANLEYCARNWASKSFSMWEELYGDHFSIRFIQRGALLKGAAFAEKMNDLQAAQYYKEVAGHLDSLLETHWKEHLGYYFETLDAENKLGGGIDMSVLMTLFYSRHNDPLDLFSLTSARVLSTAFYVRRAFETLYQINVINHAIGDGRGPLIGRYETDIYDGNQSIYGNPWFLCSNLLAAVYYAIAKQLLKGRKVKLTFVTQQFFHQVAPLVQFEIDEVLSSKHASFEALIQSLIQQGDAILRSVKKHCITYNDTPLHMSEQIDRASGEQVSARDLSWSYASLLSAIYERDKVLKLLP